MSLSESKTVDLPCDFLGGEYILADVPGLVKRLEDFFLRPEFTTSVGTYLGKYAQKIDFDAEMRGEHSHQTYEIFTEYADMIEAQLASFVESENVSADDLFSACECVAPEARQILTSLDYVMGAMAFDNFLNLAADFVGRFSHGLLSADFEVEEHAYSTSEFEYKTSTEEFSGK